MIYMSNKNLNYEAYEDDGRLIRGSNILDVFLINSWSGRLAYTRVGLYASIYGGQFLPLKTSHSN